VPHAPGRRVPDLGGEVEARRGDGPAVAGEGRVPDLAGVSAQGERPRVERAFEEVPLPTPQVGRAGVEDLLGAADPAGVVLVLGQRDPLEVRGLALAEEVVGALLERLDLALQGLLGLPLLLGDPVVGQGEALIKLSEKVNESRQKLAVIKSTFGANHPEYKKVASDVVEMQRQFEDLRRNIAGRIEADYNQSRNREVMLKHSVEETKNESDGLNTRSFQYQQLKREACVRYGAMFLELQFQLFVTHTMHQELQY